MEESSMSVAQPSTLRRRGSSRGCDECRARKIRCDQRYPICLQCEKKGISCSGPVVGSIFIDAGTTFIDAGTTFIDAGTTIMTRHSSTKDKTGKLMDRVRKEGRPKDHRSQPKNASEITTVGLVPHACFSSFKPSMRYQPSLAIPLKQHCFSQFLKIYETTVVRHPTGKYWMDYLPSHVSESTNAALFSVINAISTAYYNRTINDKSIEVQAYRWYAKGLEIQRRKLQRDLQRLHRDYVTPLEEICVPLLMSLYEVLTPTRQNGWAEHMIAAARLLEMRGPERCQSGFAFYLFRALRMGMVILSLDRKMPHAFANKRWLTVPFSELSKTPYDKLVDILSITTVYLESVHKQNNNLIFVSTRVDARLELIELGKKLDDTWQELVGVETVNYSVGTICGLETAGEGTGPVKGDFSDLSIIEGKVLFDCAKMLISTCLIPISPPELAHEHKVQVINSCASILSIFDKKENLPANILELKPLAQYRRAFPLMLIMRWSIDDTQKASAMEKLHICAIRDEMWRRR